MERIRKLIRLKKSTTSAGEANNADILVNRLLREYNLSLLDINERQPEEKFQIRRSCLLYTSRKRLVLYASSRRSSHRNSVTCPVSLLLISRTTFG